jgi:IS5 family transposase
MDSFTTWVLRGLSVNQEKSRLSQISGLIDWDPFRLILEEMYTNKTERGGRPNCDVILMFKILIIQQWYGMSDLEVERQMADRISFMSFLGFPDPFPDSRTIWLFRERLAQTGKDKLVWSELQRQLDDLGLKVRRGIVQDATFIESDPGSTKKPRGDESKTRRNRDGTWAKKGSEIHFGYKLHQTTDVDYCLIRDLETSTASMHDSQVDLSIPGVPVFRDRGYFGVKPKGIDFTMTRRTKGTHLSELDVERNRFISTHRAPGERPHAVIKRIFNAGRTLVTTIKRVHVKMVVTAFAFNLYQLCTLKKANGI